MTKQFSPVVVAVTLAVKKDLWRGISAAEMFYSENRGKRAFVMLLTPQTSLLLSALLMFFECNEMRSSSSCYRQNLTYFPEIYFYNPCNDPTSFKRRFPALCAQKKML